MLSVKTTKLFVEIVKLGEQDHSLENTSIHSISDRMRAKLLQWTGFIKAQMAIFACALD